MRVTRSLQSLHTAYRLPSLPTRSRVIPCFAQRFRDFQTSAFLQKTKRHVLSDIGEGVKEVQIIQWFVEEGAAVEEWAPLCEVQSDKASVEITSKYSGVVKKLHFERDAIVQVGESMLDIEVEGDGAPEDSAEQETVMTNTQCDDTEQYDVQVLKAESGSVHGTGETAASQRMSDASSAAEKHANLATPAVRSVLREHNIDITEIEGTGKDGRVMKEDIYKYLEGANSNSATLAVRSKPDLNLQQVETQQNLTPVQTAMFKSMTKSLSIPHFLYTDSVNVTTLAAMRRRLNASPQIEAIPKLTFLPFIIKAVSLALNQFPILNARLDTRAESGRPSLVLRSNHNIGCAMSLPAGLLVPVIKNVNARSVVSIAQEIERLSQLGHANKLSNSDLSGGTITVSNIGNIGGEVVAPVIVEGQQAIMGIGRIKPTPVFGSDGKTVERADLMSTSWSADHRVIDGATMAKMARLVQSYLEYPESMLVHMT